MSLDDAHKDTTSPGTSATGDSVIERILTGPEFEALKLYAGLSSTQQWQARTRATGERRAALALYHVLEFAQLR